MGYMIEGGGSKTMEKSKKWISDHITETKRLLSILTDVIVDYLIMQVCIKICIFDKDCYKLFIFHYSIFQFQVEAGAQLLQVFESSAEHLSVEQFSEISVPYLKEIPMRVRDGLQKKNIPSVPMVNNHNL